MLIYLLTTDHGNLAAVLQMFMEWNQCIINPAAAVPGQQQQQGKKLPNHKLPLTSFSARKTSCCSLVIVMMVRI